MSTRRRRLRPVLLAMAIVACCLVFQPATAATVKPDLSVRISSLTPTELRAKATVTVTGTVTNNNTFTWTHAQAYLVISHAPYTSRTQLDDAISSSTAYTGERVVNPNSFDDTMGDISPGQTIPFTVKVPYGQLGLTGADGVYPVGIQILGTDPSGGRSVDAIGKATTFLPMLSQNPQIKVAASIAWPFLNTVYQGTDDKYVDVESLLTSVSIGGQLRNLLDLASTTTGGHDTVIVDPALLVAVDDLAHRRNLAKDVKLSDIQVAEAASFLTDLLTLARNNSCWIVGYDRPDVLALSRNKDIATPLAAAIDAATSAAIDAYGLTGRRITWPTARGVTPGLISYARGPGDQPVIVSAGDLGGWSRRDGSLVQYATGAGPVPLLVDDTTDAAVPGQDSTVVLRQRIVSNSALAVLSRSIDPTTRADAVALVPPTWNPGTDWAAGNLEDAFNAPWVQGYSLDDLLTRPVSPLKGSVPSSAAVSPVSRQQLSAAAQIQAQTALIDAIQTTAGPVASGFDQDTASAVGVRWRRSRATGLAIARSSAARADNEIGKITIEGPKSVTLSSSNGKFPLTISNSSASSITVGIRLDSSNPALTIPDVDPTTIAAGESHTLNVNVDVRDQGSTSVAAQLITRDGKTFGTPVVFNVRSSAVGAVLWVAMGAAGLLVVVALVRRFSRQRNGTATP